jgi:hypothetical protein
MYQQALYLMGNFLLPYKSSTYLGCWQLFVAAAMALTGTVVNYQTGLFTWQAQLHTLLFYNAATSICTVHLSKILLHAISISSRRTCFFCIDNSKPL